MASASYDHAGRVDAAAADADVAAPGRGFGLLAKLVAIGLWGTLAALILSAATVPGFVVLGLLPLAGFPYLVFCLIAWTGDRDVE
jgi:hypothetical protein